MQIYSDPTAEQERLKYEKVWSTIKAYSESSPGLDLADKAIEIFEEHKVGSILDAGCGSGKAAGRFYNKGYVTCGIDITLEGLRKDVERLPIFHEMCVWDFPGWLPAYGAIYCIDVMEHIPEEKVDAVIDNLADRWNKIAIFQIAMFQDRFGEMIGERLHLTVKTKDWWERKIQRRFKNIKEIENVRGRFTFVCEVL
jgi:SAM-dependent methyltransferase